MLARTLLTHCASARAQSLEASQLESHRAALDAARASQSEAHAAYASLRDAFASVHAALSPHNLGVAFGGAAPRGGGAVAALSLDAAAYESLTLRLLESRVVAAADADLVVARLRETLAQVRVCGGRVYSTTAGSSGGVASGLFAALQSTLIMYAVQALTYTRAYVLNGRCTRPS